MKLPFKETGVTHYIDPHEIIYCKADRSYCTLYLSKGEKLVYSKPLAAVIRRLQQPCFFRIHNSFLINLCFVEQQLRSNDKHYVIMSNQEKLPVARNRRALFREVMTDFLAR